MVHLDGLLQRLFPGRSALAVNNNAGAILLAIRALSKGREVVVSRGELVEIGGAFRVPDILAASGAKMKEVGTTNRTRAADYEAAIGPKTGLLLKVHTSNFKIVGFTEETSIAELAALAHAKGLPVVVDWGSGDLIDLAEYGVRDEIPVAALLDQGADIVTFSGDKLLGGPQAGLAVGRDDLVKRMRRDPMARVLRLDRLQIAALRETLSAYVTGRATIEVPTLRMLSLAPGEIGRRAESVADEVRGIAPQIVLRLEAGVSRPGGGSSPTGEIATMLLVIEDPSGDAGRLEERLRRGDPPVVARVNEGKLVLDLRTVLPEQDGQLSRCLAAVLATSD
jgi:L-seryl-tRNA(Ser) seleniumtransferase